MALNSLKQTLHDLQGQLGGEDEEGVEDKHPSAIGPQRQSARLAVRQLRERYWLKHNLGGGFLTALQLEMATDRQAQKILSASTVGDEVPPTPSEERLNRRATAPELPNRQRAGGRRDGRATRGRFPIVRLHRMDGTDSEKTAQMPAPPSSRTRLAEAQRKREATVCHDYKEESSAASSDDEDCGVAISGYDDEELLDCPSDTEDRFRSLTASNGVRDVCAMSDRRTSLRKRRRSSPVRRNRAPPIPVREQGTLSGAKRPRMASLNARYYIQVLSDPFTFAQLLFGTPPRSANDNSTAGGNEAGEANVSNEAPTGSDDMSIADLQHDDFVAVESVQHDTDEVARSSSPPGEVVQDQVCDKVHHQEKVNRRQRLPKEVRDLIDNVRDVGMSSVTSRFRSTKARENNSEIMPNSTVERTKLKRKRSVAEIRAHDGKCTCNFSQAGATPLHQPESRQGWIASDHLQVVAGTGNCCRHLYRQISKQTLTYRLGDIVLFKPSEHIGLSLIGRLQSLWAEFGSGVHVIMQEFYRPEATLMGRRQGDGEKEVFASHHERDIDVDRIIGQCYVTTIAEYCRFRAAAKRVSEGRTETVRSAVPLGSLISRPVKDLDASVHATTNPELVFFCRYNYDHRTGRLRLRSENFAHRYGNS